MHERYSTGGGSGRVGHLGVFRPQSRKVNTDPAPSFKELGHLLITVTLIGLLLPLGAVLLTRLVRLRSA